MFIFEAGLILRKTGEEGPILFKKSRVVLLVSHVKWSSEQPSALKKNRRHKVTQQKAPRWNNTERVTLHFAKQVLQPDMHNLRDWNQCVFDRFGHTAWSEAIAGHQFTEIHWIIKALCSHCLVRGTPVGRTPGRQAIPHPCWHASLKQAPKLISNAMDLKKVQHLNRLNVWGSVCCRESPTFYVMIICLYNTTRQIILHSAFPNIMFFHIICLYSNTLMIYHHISIPCRPPKK